MEICIQVHLLHKPLHFPNFQLFHELQFIFSKPDQKEFKESSD